MWCAHNTKKIIVWPFPIRYMGAHSILDSEIMIFLQQIVNRLRFDG